MTKPTDKFVDAEDLDAFESWLRTRLTDAPPSGVERIKHRVQLAVHEEALKRAMPTLDARGATKRIKRGVRESLAASPSVRSPRLTPALRLAWWSGVTAVAAALGFALVLLPRQSGVVTPGTAPASTTITTDARIPDDEFDLSVVDDDLEDAFSSLEESLDDLETNLAEGWAATGGELLDLDAESDEPSPQSDGNGDKSGRWWTPGEFHADAIDSNGAFFDGHLDVSVNPPRITVQESSPRAPKVA